MLRFTFLFTLKIVYNTKLSKICTIVSRPEKRFDAVLRLRCIGVGERPSPGVSTVHASCNVSNLYLGGKQVIIVGQFAAAAAAPFQNSKEGIVDGIGARGGLASTLLFPVGVARRCGDDGIHAVVAHGRLTVDKDVHFEAFADFVRVVVFAIVYIFDGIVVVVVVVVLMLCDRR